MLGLTLVLLVLCMTGMAVATYTIVDGYRFSKNHDWCMLTINEFYDCEDVFGLQKLSREGFSDNLLKLSNEEYLQKINELRSFCGYDKLNKKSIREAVKVKKLFKKINKNL